MERVIFRRRRESRTQRAATTKPELTSVLEGETRAAISAQWGACSAKNSRRPRFCMTEVQIVDWLKRIAPSTGRGVVLGIGDDCAIFRPRGSSEDLLFTTDQSIEGVHFRPATLRKASDIERSVVASVTSRPWAANPDFVSCRSRSRAALPMVGSSDSIGDCSSSLIAPGLFSPEEIWQSLRSCPATSWSAAPFGAAEHSAATAHAQETESTSRPAGRAGDARISASFLRTEARVRETPTSIGVY